MAAAAVSNAVPAAGPAPEDLFADDMEVDQEDIKLDPML